MANTDNQINISDVWKDMDNVQINIGDVWKDVSIAWINIGDAWKPWWVASSTAGERGVFGGGYISFGVSSNVIDYITISTAGNATDFGNLISTRAQLAANSNGSNQRGIFAGGAHTNVIQYITINSIGNATDFGNLTAARTNLAATSNGDNDRGIIGGGDTTGSVNVTNIIDYITISTAGNATDFGDLTQARMYLSATSNGALERGVFGGGYKPGHPVYVNTIDYVTINSTGNATDFGNLTVARYGLAAYSNGTNDRGAFVAGNGVNTDIGDTIDYITISTTGNATDFGNLPTNRRYLSATSNGTSERGVSGGGSQVLNIMEYITINSTGNATDFGNLTVARMWLAATSNA